MTAFRLYAPLLLMLLLTARAWAADNLFVEYKLAAPQSYPTGIATAPDGSIWFLEYRENKLVRFDTASEQVEKFTIPSSKSESMELSID